MGEKINLAYEYTQDASLHGIGRAASKDRGLAKKIFWIVFFLSCLALFLHFFCSAVITYFQYPISTKISYTTEAMLNFPSVTICNYNKVTASYLAKKNDQMLNATIDYFNSLGQKRTEELSAYMKTVGLTEIYQEAAPTFNATYLWCTFPGVSIGDGCRLPEGLMVPTVTQMGVCHTFNPLSYIEKHGPLKSNRAGSADGLRIMIDIDQMEYKLGGLSLGAKVLVHHPMSVPRVDELGVGLSPGAEIYMAIKRNEMISLPYPYAPKEDSCVDTDDDDYVNPLEYHDQYSYSACLEEDFMSAMLAVCGCKGYYYRAPGKRNCNAYEFTTCIQPAVLMYYRNDSSPNCQKPCRDIQYDVTLSQSIFPNEPKKAMLARSLGVSPGYLSQNIILLNVYFSELGYSLIEQVEGYSFASALAEIGGYMGLCLGASILTVFELCELFWDYCARCCDSEDKKKKSTKVSDIDVNSISSNYPQDPDYAQ